MCENSLSSPPRLACFFAALLLVATGGCEDPVVEEQPDPCLGISCSGHGTCVEIAGEATCLCYGEYITTGDDCLPNGDGDGGSDGDGDGDGGSDGDGDGDGGSDGDGDGDGGSDGDGDSDGDPRCISDVAFGTFCASSGCIDGSRCERVSDEAARRQCTPSCVNDDDCPEVAPGQEACLFQLSGHLVRYCVVQCDDDDDCPCDLGCRTTTELGRICIPVPER